MYVNKQEVSSIGNKQENLHVRPSGAENHVKIQSGLIYHAVREPVINTLIYITMQKYLVNKKL